MESSKKRFRRDNNEKCRQPRAVLADMYTRRLSLVSAYACAILDKKATARLVKELSREEPLDGLLHLKRVRADKTQDGGLQILVCSKSERSEEVLVALCARYPELGRPVMVQVPAHAPLTRAQFQEASMHWPVTFHEDKRITALLSGQYFTQEECDRIHSHMGTALELAHSALSRHQEPIGAVIVDPATDSVLARSHDWRKGDNPLQHAVMVAVDMVARGQGGGMWDLTRAHDEVCICEERLSAERGLELGRLEETGGTEETERREETGMCLEGPYLCTGYDLYVSLEPCVMCAMALVHSRIGRVFYSRPHSEGALGSSYKIHVEPQLNHHYQVFRVGQGRTDTLT